MEPNNSIIIDEKKNAKYGRVFGNLPVDLTSTLEDDQERFEHLMDVGNHYVEVPAKNVLMDLYF